MPKTPAILMSGNEKTAGPTYADVIVPVPLNAAFTYAVPPAMAAGLQRGSRVLVTFVSSSTTSVPPRPT